jgi:hypothetical protein
MTHIQATCDLYVCQLYTLRHFRDDCSSYFTSNEMILCIYSVFLTLSLLMLLLVKPEILTLYIYGPMSGNAESSLFLFAPQHFNTESMQKVILWHSCVLTLS